MPFNEYIVALSFWFNVIFLLTLHDTPFKVKAIMSDDFMHIFITLWTFVLHRAV